MKALNLTDAHGRNYSHEGWQIYILKGIIIVLNYDLREVLIIRARGGSKTHDMVCICLYFAYLGWRVIYFCSKASQMTQPKKYMRRIIDGSFLLQCIKKPHREFYAKETVVFEGGGYLSIQNLTESKGRSPRCDIVLYDEEAGVEEDAYMAAESILDGSDIGLTIHASTPVKGTKFEENYDKLKLREIITGHELIFSRNYDEIYFLVNTPAKRAKYAEKKRLWPAWYFQQEYECKFTHAMGAVFQNVEYDVYEKVNNEWKLKIPLVLDNRTVSGVDWNPVSGHWCVGGRWLENRQGFLITHALPIAVGYSHKLKEEAYNIVKEYAIQRKRLCIESGGINEEYVDWFKEWFGKDKNKRDVHVLYEDWDSANINKTNAVLSMLDKTIYVDRLRFPDLAKQIEDCRWDSDSDVPKLNKDPVDSPHALDAFLHAINKRLLKEVGMRRFDWYGSQ